MKDSSHKNNKLDLVNLGPKKPPTINQFVNKCNSSIKVIFSNSEGFVIN